MVDEAILDELSFKLVKPDNIGIVPQLFDFIFQDLDPSIMGGHQMINNILGILIDVFGEFLLELLSSTWLFLHPIIQDDNSFGLPGYLLPQDSILWLEGSALQVQEGQVFCQGQVLLCWH